MVELICTWLFPSIHAPLLSPLGLFPPIRRKCRKQQQILSAQDLPPSLPPLISTFTRPSPIRTLPLQNVSAATTNNAACVAYRPAPDTDQKGLTSSTLPPFSFPHLHRKGKGIQAPNPLSSLPSFPSPYARTVSLQHNPSHTPAEERRSEHGKGARATTTNVRGVCAGGAFATHHALLTSSNSVQPVPSEQPGLPQLPSTDALPDSLAEAAAWAASVSSTQPPQPPSAAAGDAHTSTPPAPPPARAEQGSLEHVGDGSGGALKPEVEAGLHSLHNMSVNGLYLPVLPGHEVRGQATEELPVPWALPSNLSGRMMSVGGADCEVSSVTFAL